MSVTPYSLKDAPALIERVFPSQKISAESYKEQMANLGKTLTALGSYWKGRKPLVLNKAVVLGCLLPVSSDAEADLRVFELLMGMDEKSFRKRLRRPSAWRDRRLDAAPFRELVEASERAEYVPAVHDHIWDDVNAHLGTHATSFRELVEQLGVMRFGRRPKVADVFSGSGQIPFEAARLGCDVYASDLNPIACMLTWGAFNIIGGPDERFDRMMKERNKATKHVEATVMELGIEGTRDKRAKSFLYCVEVTCPETGWTVPLLPTFAIGKQTHSVVRLVPDHVARRYEIVVENEVGEEAYEHALRSGTVVAERRGADPMLVHSVEGVTYRTRIGAIRGDGEATSTGNRLRQWERRDFRPLPNDIFRERLYAVHWTYTFADGTRESVFASVTDADIEREQAVESFVAENLETWQSKGLVPDMRIEPGDKNDEPIRTRGWTHWHHLFNARQLMQFALFKEAINGSETPAELTVLLARALDWNTRLGRFNPGWSKPEQVFYNQALNTLYNYGTRSWAFMTESVLAPRFKRFPLAVQHLSVTQPAASLNDENDMYLTDAPYGSAVNYEEILEFFIAWLQSDPPPEFRDWIWDSRRSLAIKGEDDDFRLKMIEAYAAMARNMPNNGIQVMMFTHQSGRIWADIASIVWGAGLHVSAAWYVTTETDSAIRQGAYVKGTILLVLRKREGNHTTFQDDLAYELENEVKQQVEELVGLNQRIREHSARDENTFNDADLQMAGYAAALRVLTKYRTIDGRDMIAEAQRPRAKGETTIVDTLIDFAVDLANAALVPQGISDTTWGKLNGLERYYLKMLEQEAHGVSSLDSFQQFAKAFRVRESQAVMASARANQARLKSCVELGRSDMNDGSEFGGTTLRAVLFAMQQLANEADRDKVLTGLRENVRDYYNQRSHVRALAQYLHQTLGDMRPEEAEYARVVDLFVMNEGV